MTTLLKGEMKKEVKFPTILETDDFKKKFNKMSKYFGKTMTFSEEELLKQLSDKEFKDFLGLSLVTFDELEVDDDTRSDLTYFFLNNLKISDFSLFKFILNDDMLHILTDNVPVKHESQSYFFKYSGFKFKVMSFGWLYLSSYLNNIVLPVLSDNGIEVEKSHILWHESFFKYYNNKKYFEYALDRIIYVNQAAYLNRQFDKASGKTISTFKTDKKYQDEELNKNTLFNHLGFKKVEVDTEKYKGQEFDYIEFSKVEEAFKGVYPFLPKGRKEPELRFRKLGKHNALGLYSPSYNVLAVDVRHTSSFLHEYGHYLDFNHGDAVYSQDEAFSVFRKHYEDSLEKFNIDNKKYSYFTIPTEIFARGFELWVAKTIAVDGRLIDLDKLKVSPEYLAFDGVKDGLFKYFESIFVN